MKLRTAGVILVMSGVATTARAQSTGPVFEWPGLSGIMLPVYDRANGLSFPVAGSLSAYKVNLYAEPRLTYRSQLGRIDPWIDVVDSLRSGVTVRLGVGRATLTNDSWIRADALNSLATLFSGEDSRNYFRTTRGEAAITWEVDPEEPGLTKYVGVRAEHALTVRPGFGASGGPWSLFGRHDTDDMLRPNPAVDNGLTTSLLGGGEGRWAESGIIARAGVDLEVGRTSPDAVAGRELSSRVFGQATVDGSITYPTFGDQSVRFAAHAVLTTRGRTPRQRWVYLGGSGTLPTLGLLELGGDQLVYVDALYQLPIPGVTLPLGESLVVSLRDAIGGAAVGKAPSLHQTVGLRLAAGPLFAEADVDPATRVRHFGVGISFAR